MDDAFIEEYKKTEVLRQSVKDVKERAKEEQDKRKNIRHVNISAKSMSKSITIESNCFMVLKSVRQKKAFHN